MYDTFNESNNEVKSADDEQQSRANEPELALKYRISRPTNVKKDPDVVKNLLANHGLDMNTVMTPVITMFDLLFPCDVDVFFLFVWQHAPSTASQYNSVGLVMSSALSHTHNADTESVAGQTGGTMCKFLFRLFAFNFLFHHVSFSYD